MTNSSDRPSGAATPPTAREQRIAEETVSTIDFASRLLGAIEGGNWNYAVDKSRQLQRTLKALDTALLRTDRAAAGPVAAIVRRGSRHYRIGKALYGDRSSAAESSPVAQAEQAKRERDLSGEVGALQAGYEALISAPWYPAQAGDLVHVFYWGSLADAMPPQGETYVVEHSEKEGGLVLRLLHADEHLAGPDGGAGMCAPGLPDDPLMELWMEAGPAALTIVRAGRVVHGAGVPR